MFRPVTITHPVVVNDGKPFDACKGFLTVRKTEESVTNEELELAQCIVIFQHAKALNPPIKVTDAVLKAMEKAGGAYSVKSILVNAPDYSYNLHFDDKKRVFTFRGGMTFDINEQDVPIYTVQADCPLALQVLLGFTVEGVPKDE